MKRKRAVNLSVSRVITLRKEINLMMSDPGKHQFKCQMKPTYGDIGSFSSMELVLVTKLKIC